MTYYKDNKTTTTNLSVMGLQKQKLKDQFQMKTEIQASDMKLSLWWQHHDDQRNTNIYAICTKVWRTFKMQWKNENEKKSSKKSRLSIVKKQLKNLKQFLIKSEFDFSDNEPSVMKCRKSRWKTCPDVIEGNLYSSEIKKIFNVKNSMNCTSKNAIYMQYAFLFLDML